MFLKSPNPTNFMPRPSDFHRHPKIKMASCKPEVVIIIDWDEVSLDRATSKHGYIRYLFPVNAYKYFRFAGRHLDFRVSVKVGRSRRNVFWIRQPPKHGNIIWNFADISSRSIIISTSGLWAAILIFGCRSKSGGLGIRSFVSGDVGNCLRPLFGLNILHASIAKHKESFSRTTGEMKEKDGRQQSIYISRWT